MRIIYNTAENEKEIDKKKEERIEDNKVKGIDGYK